MSKAMNASDWTARAEAYEEAADHLNLEWTDDPCERAQGNIVQKKLRAEGANCRRIAASAPQ